MADPEAPDFVAKEMLAIAEQTVQQARSALEEVMTATQRVVSTFETQALSTQNTTRAMQRKVARFVERNVAASFEFAQALLTATSPVDVMRQHAGYLSAQTETLAEQAREMAEQAANVAASPSRDAA